MSIRSNSFSIFSTAVIGISSMCLGQLQSEEDGGEVRMKQKKLNGPRMGITYVLPEPFDRDGTFNEKIEDKGIDAFISQFGWHFEWIVAPETAGPSFVIQVVPFLGGVEYGVLLPSVSGVLGVRLPIGFEFGMGPNILVVFDKEEPVTTNLLVAAGQTIKFGEVQIPINLALTTNKGGNRVSFVFGYAIPSRKKRAKKW